MVISQQKLHTLRIDHLKNLIDLEISFVESHQDVIKEEEKVLVAALQRIKDDLGEEIKRVFGFEIEVPTLPFPQMTMKEAKEALAKLGIKSEKAGDLSSEEEKALGEYVSNSAMTCFLFSSVILDTLPPFFL